LVFVHDPGLSVSSFGSNPLQPLRIAVNADDRASLSVSSFGSNPLQLGLGSPGAPEASQLSVSSFGSNPLQHACFRLAQRSGCFFQYPRSDRTLCNRQSSMPSGPLSRLSVSSFGSNPLQLSTDGTTYTDISLSVSSFGSNPLQLKSQSSLSSLILTFSILVRIEPSATVAQYRGRNRATVTFSILVRIEPSATEVVNLVSQIIKETFSILVRIEPSATLVVFHADHHVNDAFSILVRIEPSATIAEALAVTGNAKLSVSSFGSNPLQQPFVGCCAIARLHFQYPRSDRTLCNEVRHVANRALAAAFQYPRSDRTLCNPRWIAGEPEEA